MDSSQRKLVGIDLGTTYSSVSCLDESDKPHPVLNRYGKSTTPSIVYFPEGGQPPLVGRDAIKPGCVRPERFVEHAKRYLGSDEVAWEIDGVLYTPVDISAIILARLLEDARAKLGPITSAVITVPAHFTGYQRQLTMEAGRQAGLTNVSIVNEPVAAALSFVLADRVLGADAEALRHLDEEDSTVLVFDLGGGTFDLSIVRYDRHQLRVMAASGDERLGGIDWDDKLLEIAANKLRPKLGDIRADQSLLRRLRFELEAAKRQLSDANHVVLTVPHAKGDVHVTLSREEFERHTRSLVDRARRLTTELLTSTGLEWDELELILPVGAATRMPMIRTAVEDFANLAHRGVERRQFRKNNIRWVDPSLSIANGAALFAGIIQSDAPLQGTGAVTRTLSNYRTQNVATNGLGVIVHDKDGNRVVHPLIERQTPLPATANVTLATTRRSQERASIRIVEGEHSVEKRKVLCKCTLDNLPPDLQKNSLFDISVTFDADGVLNVTAKHRDTGRLATVSALYGSE
jgi:molecular chaperone DnaK